MKKMTLDQIREISTYFAINNDMNAGVCTLVDVENMGFCKDGVTCWYTFYDDEGNKCIYFKY